MTIDVVLPPASGDRSNAAKLAALGAASGAISWGLVNFSRELNLDFELDGTPLLLLPLSVYPGLVFGLVFGAVFYRRARLTRERAIGYAMAALLGYLAAFHVAFYSIANGFDDSDSPLAYGASGVAGGLAGALLLGLLGRFLLRLPGALVLRRPVATGAIAGAFLGLATFDSHNGWGFFAFFILWQGAYAGSLAPLLRRPLSDS